MAIARAKERDVRSKLAAGLRSPSSGSVTRPQIVVSELSDAVDDGIQAISALGGVYQRGGRLVDVVHEPQTRPDGEVVPSGAARIRTIPQARLRELTEQAARWTKRKLTPDGNELMQSIQVPEIVLDAIAGRGEWAYISPLDGVVTWPVVRSDGSLLCAPGYDAATKLLCQSSVSIDVPTAPSMTHVKAAVGVLRELVCDFPFESEAHFSAWLSLLLTMFARHAIDGPVPLGLIDGNQRGIGKTLLAELIGLVVQGVSLPRRTVPNDSGEWRKSMLAIAMAADPIVLFDNVVKKLASDTLDAVLTGTVFRERILGQNQEVCLPVKTLFLVTSNNATISTDLVRRSVHVRLESARERPEQRADIRHADLRQYALKHRARLASAALTILVGYEAARRPACNLLPMGSYTEWSEKIRKPLVWAGLPDPLLTQAALREMADPEVDALAALLAAWHDQFGARTVRVAELLGVVTHEPAGPIAQAVTTLCETAGACPDARKLGNLLRSRRGQVAGGFALEVAGAKSATGVPWRVHRLVAPSRSATDDSDDSQLSLAKTKCNESSPSK